MNLRLYHYILILISIGSVAVSKAQEQSADLIIRNNIISRKLKQSGDSLIGYDFMLRGDSQSFISKSSEFSFQANNNFYDGFSGWQIASVEDFSAEHKGVGKKIVLNSKNDLKVQVTLHYITYPDLPVIRKYIVIENVGNIDLNLEEINVEHLQSELAHESAQVLHKYARMKHLGRFVGDWDDPLVVVHDMSKRRGLALGNEIIGVLKRTAYHTEGHRDDIQIGYSHSDQNFPFRKWIRPNEKFKTAQVFTAPYAGTDDAFRIVNEEVNRFMILHMQPQIIRRASKPTFVYNTWYPFRTYLSDSLMQKVSDAAAECGFEEIIIDDGWQINIGGNTSKKEWGANYGDWQVDETKFPTGLKPVFDQIKSQGMRPGLWISIASATSDAKVYQSHPEWFVINKDGDPGNLHYSAQNGAFISASFGTGWYDYIRDEIIKLVDSYGLEYAKLDLAVVTSPYVNDDEISGSYASDHPYYRDHHESFYVIYDRLIQLFDELHAHSPELFIDCTFETAGKLHLMDYALAQHADGNWLSNFEEPSPTGPLRVRQMAWWRTPVMPASSLVIGNLPIDDPNFEFGLKSLIGTLPIVLGDPTKLPKAKRAKILEWSKWIRKMQDQYDYMSYRKDLAGFGEPKEGAWDGWQRINFQTENGGILGVFRQGALENSRRIFVDDINADLMYEVRRAPDEKLIMVMSGKKLMTEGMEVSILEEYGGTILEIRKK